MTQSISSLKNSRLQNIGIAATTGTVSAATSVPWTGVTSKPTTLTGFGITDAAASSHIGSTGTAHGVVTTNANGFMSSADKTKLDGIATNANNYVLPAAAATTLGGIKVSLSGTTLTITTS